MTPLSKTCTGCNQELPLEDFQCDRKGKYGRTARCRVCVSERQGSKHTPRSKVEGMKICTSCLRELPLVMFTKAARGKLGRCAECKDCQAAYRSDNADRSSNYSHTYRETHTEELRLADQEYYRTNADAIKSRVARYAHLNPEVSLRSSRNFRKNHPDRVRLNVVNRRARKRKAEGHFTLADINRQHEIQKGCCYWCSEPFEGKYHIDHVIPLARNGSNWPENLVIACPKCNRQKSDKLPYSEWLPPNPPINPAEYEDHIH